MKNNIHKRKRVVIDVVDGKIINDSKALKLDNVEEYLEKNGFRMIKLFLFAMIFTSFIPYAHAEGYDASYMTRLDLTSTTNVYMLLGALALSIVFLLIGINKSSFVFFLLGNLIMLFVGLILMINGFVVILGLLITIVPLILIFLWKE